MRKLGIVGGTSWSSTALYYEHINRGIARRLGGLHSARLAIESLDLAPVAERELAEDWEEVAQMLSAAARRLEAGGADGILLASNTSHKVYEEIRSSLSVPLLHIAEPTADRLVADRATHIALLGTRFTMTGTHVRERIERRGIRIAPIEDGWIAEVDRIIFEELAAGKVIRDSQRKLKTLIADLARNKVQAVVLGCTELVLAVDVRANVIPVYDTTAIHAEAAVDWMLEDEDRARQAA